MDPLLDRVEPGETSHRLLGGWRDILDDIQKLDVSLDKLPDHCGCGDGSGHLRVTCACCIAGTSARGCVACELARVKARVRELRDEAKRVDREW